LNKKIQIENSLPFKNTLFFEFNFTFLTAFYPKKSFKD